MGGILLPIFGDNAAMSVINPNQIPNLNIWYNGSALTTTVNGVSQQNFSFQSGTQVKTWNDLSGTGHPSSAQGAAYPDYATNVQNGLSAVQYTAANGDNLDINPLNTWLSTSVTGFTMFFVARPTALTTIFPLVVTETEMGIWWNGTNWSCGQSVGNYGTVTLTNNTSKMHMYGMIFDGTATGNANRLRFNYDKVNQSLSFTGTIGANVGGPAYFFFGGDSRARSVSTTFYQAYMTGYIGEVLMWTKTLTPSEITGIQNYLNNKWALGL